MATSVRFALHIAEHACAAVLVSVSEHQAASLHEAHGWNIGEWPIWATLALLALLLAAGAVSYRVILFWRAHFEAEKRARLAEQQRVARQRDIVQAATATLTIGIAVGLVFWQHFASAKTPTAPII